MAVSEKINLQDKIIFEATFVSKTILHNYIRERADLHRNFSSMPLDGSDIYRFSMRK